jgi:hypothetical protein
MLHDLAQWLRLAGDGIGGLLMLVGTGYVGYVLIFDHGGGSPWLTGVAVAAGGAFILAVGRGLSWVLVGTGRA